VWQLEAASADGQQQVDAALSEESLKRLDFIK